MTEFGIGTLASLGLVGLALSCFFYQWGGRSGKWKRRFIASAILATTVNVLLAIRGLWGFLHMAIYPLLVLGFSMGYGGNDDPIGKIVRRFLYAAGVLSSGLLMALTLGGNAWWVFLPHVGVGLFSIWLGVRNPIEAAAEEVFVCASLNLFLVAYPFIVHI